MKPSVLWTGQQTLRPGGARAGRALKTREMHVLRLLGSFYAPELGCAYPKMSKLALACGWKSEAYVRSVIADLEECGLVGRRAQQRVKDGSQTTNLYDFPLMGYAAGWPAGCVAKDGSWAKLPEGCGPMCSADEWPMRRAAEEGKQAARDAFFDAPRTAMRRDGFGPAAVQMVLGEAAPPPDSEAAPPPDSEAAVDCSGDGYGDLLPPIRSPLPLRESAKAPVMGKARTTARATATAATVAARDAEEARTGFAGAGLSSGPGAAASGVAARPWDVRGRRERDARQPRGQAMEFLDGEDAAWRDEVTRVMCALSAVGAGLRGAIEQQLRLYVDRHKCTIAAAGQLAVQRWDEYTSVQVLRPFYVAPKRFFREGLWLRPGAWGVQADWYRDRLSRPRTPAWKN